MQHNTKQCYTLSGIDEGQFSYIAVGCGGTAEDDQKRVAKAIYDKIAGLSEEKKPLPKFIALLGDNVYHHGVKKPDDEQRYEPYKEYFYDIYKKIYQDFNIPFFCIIGNHGYNYETKTLLRSGLPGFDENCEWGPNRAKNLVDHSWQSTKTQDAVLELKEDDPRRYNQKERTQLNSGHEFNLHPEEGQKPLPMYNMPFNFYKLQAGQQHFFFLDSNVYLSHWLILQEAIPEDEERRKAYLKRMMNRGNQAAWLECQIQRLGVNDKITFLQHHPLLSRAKRGDPLVKSDLNRYMHTVDERERLRKALNLSPAAFDSKTVNDLLLSVYQRQLIVNGNRRIKVHCAHAHTQFHVSDVHLKIDQTTSGGGGGDLEHEFFPHRQSSEIFERNVDSLVAASRLSISIREAEQWVDHAYLQVAKKTKFYADNFGFATHTVSTNGATPHEVEVLALGAIKRETGDKNAIYKIREEIEEGMSTVFAEEPADVRKLRLILHEATQAYLSFLVRTQGSWQRPRYIPSIIWPQLCKLYLKLGMPFKSHSKKGKVKAIQVQKELLNHAAMTKLELIVFIRDNFSDFFHRYDKYTFIKAHLYQHSLYMFIDKACKEHYGLHLNEFVDHHFKNKDQRLEECQGLDYSMMSTKSSLTRFIAGWKVLSYVSATAEEHYLRGDMVTYFALYWCVYWPWLFLVVIPASATSMLVSVCALVSEGLGLVADYAERHMREDYKQKAWGGVLFWFCVWAVCNVIYYFCRQIFSVQQSALDWQNRTINFLRPRVGDQCALRMGAVVWWLSVLTSILLIAAVTPIVLPCIAPLISSFSVIYWFQHFVHWKFLTRLLKGFADFFGPIFAAMDKPFSLTNVLPGKLTFPHPIQHVVRMPEAGPLEVVSPTLFAVNSLAIAGVERQERRAEAKKDIEPEKERCVSSNQAVTEPNKPFS